MVKFSGAASIVESLSGDLTAVRSALRGLTQVEDKTDLLLGLERASEALAAGDPGAPGTVLLITDSRPFRIPPPKFQLYIVRFRLSLSDLQLG